MPAPNHLGHRPSPTAVLRRFFGYEHFRSHQAAIIDELLAGRDAFALMPTGSGKSLCYQIPSLIREGVGLVISPLIALMQDQVAALNQNGVRAAFLNSSLSAEAAAAVERQLLAGRIDLLYVAPERLLTARFQSFLQRFPLALVAIDEAHCVSQWGHDFRPEYLQIRQVTDQFPDVPRIALTATADALTRRDILERLGMPAARPFVASFDRPNIRYRVTLKQNGRQQLLGFLRRDHPGEAGIVYARTRRRVEETTAWLCDQGIGALSYHAGLPVEVRADHQHRFQQEDGRVMVATIAFGMGIDKPDVRFVAHLDLPSSMEAYYQETGRAGRDGLPAEAWMVYSLGDVVALRHMLDASDAGEEFRRIRQRKLEALLGYCECSQCRRQVLLGYFDEDYGRECGNCDNCLEGVETWDGTVAAQKALSCVYRTGQRFGAAYLTDVLTGADSERIRALGHHRIKTYAVGRELNPVQWRGVFRQLLAAGLLSTTAEAKAGFRLTEKSWPVLKGDTSVRLRRDAAGRPASARSPKANRATVTDLNRPQDQALWERLRQLRLTIAREKGVPPYVIFHDKTLAEMVARRPTTPEALLAVTGIGEHKAAAYGDRFLAALCDAPSASPQTAP